MQKKLLLISIFGSIISSTSYAYTLYSNDKSSLDFGGRIEPRFNVSDANKTMISDTSFEDISRIRFNIDGKTKISEKINVFGYYSGEVFSDRADDKNRYMYAGVGTPYGSFSYGQQDSAQVVLTNATDIMETFGYSAVNITNGNNEELENNFVYMAQLPMNLSVSANYIRSELIGNNSGGASLMYNAPYGLQLGVGYVNGQQNGEDAYQYSISSAYTKGDLYFGAIFVKGEVNHVEVHGVEAAAAYTLNDFIFRYVYNYRTSDFTNVQLKNNYAVNYNAIEGVYNFADNFMVYGGYEFNNLKGRLNSDQFQAGVLYTF